MSAPQPPKQPLKPGDSGFWEEMKKLLPKK